MSFVHTILCIAVRNSDLYLHEGLGIQLSGFLKATTCNIIAIGKFCTALTLDNQTQKWHVSA